MRILVTGATGFIGQHVLEALSLSEHEVLAAGRNGSRNQIKIFRPEVCIHLAWEGLPDYSEALCVSNLRQSLEFFDFLSKETHCKKLIVSGSCWEYGKTHGGLRENDRTHTPSYFVWAKKSLYCFASLLSKKRPWVLVWFRLFYVYGPGQRQEALLPALLRSFKEGRSPGIRSPGNQNDFIYVGDVAKAMRLAAELPLESGVYNLGSGKATPVHEVSRMAEKRLRGNTGFSDMMIKNGFEEGSFIWADMTKTFHALNWSPSTSLEEGIAATLQKEAGREETEGGKKLMSVMPHLPSASFLK